MVKYILQEKDDTAPEGVKIIAELDDSIMISPRRDVGRLNFSIFRSILAVSQIDTDAMQQLGCTIIESVHAGISDDLIELSKELGELGVQDGR